MAHLNSVIRSVNLTGDAICVDIFRRPDGRFGFNEFRRDPEDTRGWYSIGHFSERRFDSAEAAMQDAVTQVHWLADHI